MKKKHLLKIVVAFVLCAAMVLPFVPITAEAEAINNFDITNFEGKHLSIIGDSISTYEGVSNNTDYNDTIGSNAVYYGGTSRDDWATAIEPLGVSLEDTWWMQTIDTLGMELCVNNSYSGSCIRNDSNSDSVGSKLRCRQLHNVAGERPDIIALYLGTNDCNKLVDVSALGTPDDSMYNTVSNNLDNTSFAPSTILGAYSLMVARVKDEYPNAEIYCFTLLPKVYDGSDANDAVYDTFNAGVKTIAAHYGCYVVDLFNESGLHEGKLYQEYCYMTDPVNSLHPLPVGMDAITNCFISSMMKNSKYMNGTTRYSVTYDLANTYVKIGNVQNGVEMYGDVTTAVAGKPFQVELGTAGTANIEVKVTMGGEDISTEVVHGDVITIDKVTGDISITATEFDNFYWSAGQKYYISNPDQDAVFNYNAANLVSGYEYVENGNFPWGEDGEVLTVGHFKLGEPAMLLHNRPWVLEFKATGVGDLGYRGGILLTSDTARSNVCGNTYIHLNQSQLLIGYSDHYSTYSDNTKGGYNNSGYGWDQIATKVGSSSGDLFRNETHVYRLENKVNADGSNMVYLYVDGVEIGAMNKGEATACEISGRDYLVNYLGTSNHPLQACNIHYLKIYENGVPTEKDTISNFRWSGVGESLTTADDDAFFTENVADIEMGTGVNGVHEANSYYSLDKPITLLHDRAWTIEWRAKGTWGAGSGEDPMLFSTVDGNPASYPGAMYLWRNSKNLIAFGYHQGYREYYTETDYFTYRNYGIDVSDWVSDSEEYYVYRIQNVVTYDADGNYVSNMPYLYLNDVEIGPMNNYHRNGISADSQDDWLSGKDMLFSYIGNQRFPINGVTFDYIQVWENGYAVDTLRLEYLINNRLDSSSSFNSDSWTAYNNAINAGTALLKEVSISQDKVEAAVDAIMAARSQLVTTYTGETKIYSAELVTGDYVRVGKQTGIKVVTTPDVAQVCVGSQTLIVNSSQIQTILIDGVETEVKVWLLTFQRTNTSDLETSYGIGAFKSYDAAHSATSANGTDAYVSLPVKYTSNFVTDIQILTNPTKTAYVDGEIFDATGMVVQIKRKNSTDWETVTDYVIINPKLYQGDKSVTIEYEGARGDVPVTVTAAE